MTENKVENLVICSTLNQITNYLIIEKYKPSTIYNITFDEDAKQDFNININPHQWDKQLKEKCKNIKFIDIRFSTKEMRNLKKIKRKLKDQIIEKVPKYQKIYWHVTGGQRTVALAISELIKEKSLMREKDKIIYIEGNTEKLIINDNQGNTIKDDYIKNNYGNHKLTFLDVLNLVGFKCKSEQLKSTKILKEQGKKLIEKSNKEYKFYKKLHEIVMSEYEEKNKKNYSAKFINKDKKQECHKGCFRDLLLKSNSIKNNKNETQRQDFIESLFEDLLEKSELLQEIGYYDEKKDSKEDNEFKKSYPAGYIFEKLVAYKIYDLVKDNPKIVGMETSLKTYFKKDEENKSEKDNIIDEIDIILLTDTGKIISFECKSGGMKGDNAKSHKYTTYRLAGVFGMPILLSPLYSLEETDNFNDEELEKQSQALRAAKSAELEVFTIDKIKEGLERLGII